MMAKLTRLLALVALAGGITAYPAWGRSLPGKRIRPVSHAPMPLLPEPIAVDSTVGTSRNQRLASSTIGLKSEPRVSLLSRTNRVASSGNEESRSIAEMGTVRGPWGYGAEVGGLLNRSNINSDLLGLQRLYGGRAFVRIPVLNRHWYAVPSLGYFHRSDSEAGVTVSQNVFELGGSLLFAPWPTRSTLFLFGLAQRLDGLISNISALGNSASTPLGFRYRLGPQAELSTPISRRLSFVADIDVTFTTTVPIHPYGGISLGLMFK